MQATAAAKGAYGGGGMANAMQANALTQHLQNYGNAAKMNLENQTQRANALWNPVNLGATVGQNLGNTQMKAADVMGTLAQLKGKALATTAEQRSNIAGNLVNRLSSNPAILNGLSTAGRAVWDKLSGAFGDYSGITDEELDTLRNDYYNSDAYINDPTASYYDY